jgi:alcohol dehydrogenase (cytochrome c)
MTKTLSLVAAAILSAIATQAFGQNEGFQPVTSEVLANPPPGDWLMINRTYDEQRFSPLDQINKSNAGQLQMAWSRGLPTGTNETTPIVHQGVMYTVNPGGGVIAINATNGDLIWEYERQYPKEMADFVGGPERARSKGLAIY